MPSSPRSSSPEVSLVPLGGSDCAAVFSYALPLARPLPGAASGLSRREGVLLRLRGEGGGEAWGDCAPLPGFSRETLAEALEQLRAYCASGALPSAPHPSVDFAVHSALHSLAVVRGECAADVRPLRVNALCTGSGPALAAEVALAREAGFSCVKIKVGGRDPEREAAAIAALVRTHRGALAFRLDANRAWTLGEALAFARALGGVPIGYIEEPLAEPAQLPEFIAASGCPVALDESLALREARAMPGVRAWVLKPTLREGWSGAAVRIAEARSRGIKPVLSAAFESGIGLHSLAALAAGHGLQDAPSGFDTGRWLAADVARPPFVCAGGIHHPSAAPPVAVRSGAKLPAH